MASTADSRFDAALPHILAHDGEAVQYSQPNTTPANIYAAIDASNADERLDANAGNEIEVERARAIISRNPDLATYGGVANPQRYDEIIRADGSTWMVERVSDKSPLFATLVIVRTVSYMAGSDE